MDSTDVNLVALTPADMLPAQQALAAWCSRKVQALEDELAELEQHQALAVANGWKTSVVEGALNRTTRRITYYQKMRAAVEAGYLLVPNMPVEVVAVRVDRARQPEIVSDHDWGRFSAVPQASLPAGVGRYVDDEVFHRDESYDETRDGKQVHVKRYVTAGYDEVDFPVALTKPVVLSAVARAMALRIFDQIGRVQNGGGRDPIYVGQLRDPRGNGRMATFFLAWWVDTSTL